jgi:HlyD family secretion protein
MGCDGGETENQSPAGLEIAVVERGNLESTVEATGTVEPILVIEVKSQASGEILDAPMELGDRVAKDALIAHIDPRDVQNAFEQADADLDVARAGLQVAERQLERIEKLHDSAVVTDEELESATLQHANARAALVKAQTNLELASEKRNDVTVRAPISGTIVEKNVEEGQIVTSTREVTGGTTLVRMADLSEVQVRTLVDETDIGRVQPGLPATITVQAYPDREFEGSVLKVEPQAVVEQNVTMFAVLIRIRNDNDLLRPGMNADVEIEVGARENVLMLPNAAVKTADEAAELAPVLGIELPEPIAAPGDGAPGDGGSPAVELPEGAERLRSMSSEERREYFMNLDPAERQRLMAAGRAMRESRAQSERDPGRHRPAYAFRYDAEGRLAATPILISLSTWESTEVISGLEAGDSVVMVPQSLIQQRELLERVRERTGVPGVQRARSD